MRSLLACAYNKQKVWKLLHIGCRTFIAGEKNDPFTNANRVIKHTPSRDKTAVHALIRRKKKKNKTNTQTKWITFDGEKKVNLHKQSTHDRVTRKVLRRVEISIDNDPVTRRPPVEDLCLYCYAATVECEQIRLVANRRQYDRHTHTQIISKTINK